jgi:hypothetical protein
VNGNSLTAMPAARRRGKHRRTNCNRFNQKKGTTVTIVRVGPTKKYSDGWDAAFGKKSGGRSAAKTKLAGSSGVKSKKKIAPAGAKKKAKK